MSQVERGGDDCWPTLDQAYDSLVDQEFETLVSIVGQPEQIENLSQGAIDSAEERHNPQQAARALEAIYGRSASIRRRQP